MRNLNNVILIGNLTRTLGENPQYKDLVYFQNGTAKAVLSIAVNDTKKDQQGNYVDEVNFFNVTLFGKQVDALKGYLVKGQKIAVSGKLHQNRWTDQNGQNHSNIEIIAESIELCGGHSNGQNQMQNPVQGQNPQMNAPQQYAQPQQNFAQNPQMQNPQQYQNAPQNPQPMQNQQYAQNPQQQGFMDGFIEDIPF